MNEVATGHSFLLLFFCGRSPAYGFHSLHMLKLARPFLRTPTRNTNVYVRPRIICTRRRNQPQTRACTTTSCHRRLLLSLSLSRSRTHARTHAHVLVRPPVLARARTHVRTHVRTGHARTHGCGLGSARPYVTQAPTHPPTHPLTHPLTHPPRRTHSQPSTPAHTRELAHTHRHTDTDTQTQTHRNRHRHTYTHTRAGGGEQPADHPLHGGPAGGRGGHDLRQ